MLLLADVVVGSVVAIVVVVDIQTCDVLAFGTTCNKALLINVTLLLLGRKRLHNDVEMKSTPRSHRALAFATVLILALGLVL
jgi:hypothetical protein